jgi:RsiW-degrading membrane proteinase PrsW (M82 family)
LNRKRDGIVYAALGGLGFNWFEAALYVAQGFAAARGHIDKAIAIVQHSGGQ